MGTARQEGSKGEDEEKVNGKKPMDRTLMKHVAILTGSQLMLNMGFSQVVPVLPLFAQQMGGHLGATGVGLIIAAPSITRLLFNIPLGRLCDKVGRKPLMWAGTGCTAIGTIATGFATSIETMLPWRLLVGIGSSSSMTGSTGMMYWAPYTVPLFLTYLKCRSALKAYITFAALGSTAYMQDLSDQAPEHRAKIMGFQGVVIGSVWIVGPALGGQLAEWYGYQNSFIIAGIGSALCSLGYRQLPETLRPSTRPPSPSEAITYPPPAAAVNAASDKWVASSSSSAVGDTAGGADHGGGSEGAAAAVAADGGGAGGMPLSVGQLREHAVAWWADAAMLIR